MTTGSIPPLHHDEDKQAALDGDSFTYQEVRSLALYLCEHEGLTLGNAMRQAAEELEVLLTFAQGWDAAVELTRRPYDGA